MDDAAQPTTGALPRSLTRTGQGHASHEALVKRTEWWLLVGLWTVLALLVVVYAVARPGGIPIFGDNAMRMVTATEVLEGQGWQDLTAYRDNTPHGAPMHWSRLVDAPIALLIVLVRPVVGAAAVEIAAIVWPLLLVFPLLALSAVMVRRLVPESDMVTILALPMVSIVVIVEFLPGRVDHHNVQMVLTLLSACALLIGRKRIAGAVVAGLTSATSLAIGMETLPFAAVTIAIYGLLWLTEPRSMVKALVWFAVALGGGAVLHFLIATPPSSYFDPACDVLSIAYVVPALAGAVGLAGVALAGSSFEKLWQRSLMLAAAGTATLVVVVALFPACLGGPYDMEQLLVIPGYFDEILEAKPLLNAIGENPANAFAYVGAVLVGLLLTIWRAATVRGEQRVDWLIILSFLVVASAVVVLQLRGVRFAAMFALPGAVWLITQMRMQFANHGGVRRAMLLLGSWLLVSGAAHVAVLALYAAVTPNAGYANVVLAEMEEKESCIRSSSYTALATLSPAAVVAPLGLGPNILLYTRHTIVSAGFHRNVEGTTAAIGFFAGNEVSARRIVRERGIAYVVVCPLASEYAGTIGPGPGATWSWLEPLSTAEEPLQIYRVRL